MLKRSDSKFAMVAIDDGKNTIKQEKLRSKIIKMTTQEKPKVASQWLTQSLAKY